jgi:hypothetical protein
MFARKLSVQKIGNSTCRKQLEDLYQRRSTINALIQSLQRYDRYRAPRVSELTRKSA